MAEVDISTLQTPQGLDECGACARRAAESPNMSCCRCQDREAFCNNNLGAPREPRLPVEDFPVRTGQHQGLDPGLACANSIDCELFGDCSKDHGSCRVAGKVLDTVSVRQGGGGRRCAGDQVLCCNPVPGDLLQTRLGLITGGNTLGDGDTLVDDGVCETQKLAAVINFNFGVTCGKRDSRVYHQERQSGAEGGVGEVTNPGEWPWAVLIFEGDKYVGAGVLMKSNVVVTTAPKVLKYLDTPGALTVRLGDFNPAIRGPNSIEDFPHLEKEVECVKVHPKYRAGILPYSVAVLRTRDDEEVPQNDRSQGGVKVRPHIEAAASVVDLRSVFFAPSPADHPEGIEGFRRNQKKEFQYSELSTRAGLLADINNKVDSLGEPVVGEPVDNFIRRSYVNTACLPTSPRQFPAGTRCWVAAWGKGLHEQREVSLPLVSKEQCERQLLPEFQARSVPTWSLHSTELCAGGVSGEDTCEGEGGAPLVCLDEDKDQFYAVGLVGYGFGCKDAIPAVYTNLADPEVKRFIIEAFEPNVC